MRVLKLVIVVLALFAVAAAPASAAPIEWHGGFFDLEIVGAAGDQYTVRYTADLTNFEWGIGNERNWDLYINAIAFKVGSEPIPDGVEVLETNAGSAEYWNPVVYNGWMSGSAPGGIGCSSGEASVICADLNTPNLFAAPTDRGDSYYWVFRITMPEGVVPTVSGQPIRAEFLNARGEHSGLLSETTAAVPEPTSMMLLGTGLLGVALLLNRRRR